VQLSFGESVAVAGERIVKEFKKVGAGCWAFASRFLLLPPLPATLLLPFPPLLPRSEPALRLPLLPLRIRQLPALGRVEVTIVGIFL
jgi:hypothetical protein